MQNGTMIIYYGSPHEFGNVSTLADAFAQAAAHSYTVKKVYLNNVTIHPCQGCNHCKDQEGACVLQDDMIPLAQDFINASAVCFATSVYWWGVTAQTKLFIDRLYMIPKEAFVGKKLYVIAVGEDELNGIQYELINRQFKEIAAYCNMEYAGYLPVSADDDRPASENKEAMEQARTLIKETT
ncbi:MAG: flavodoxin family protein [Sphaerochaetaceae bacterium]|jgi:multimeric flavodoxin WrbA